MMPVRSIEEVSGGARGAVLDVHDDAAYRWSDRTGNQSNNGGTTSAGPERVAADG